MTYTSLHLKQHKPGDSSPFSKDLTTGRVLQAPRRAQVNETCYTP